MSSLADMAQARQLTQETESIVARLRGALGGGDPVNVFRDMRMQREQTTALKNRVEKVRADLLAVDARAVAGFSSPELTAVRTKRREVEAQLGSAPQEAEQLQRRAQDGVRAYLQLDKELSRAKVEMLGIEAQITATDLFLQQTSTARDPNATAAVKAELATQRGALTVYRDQVKKLSIDIEAARLHVGVGDELAQREEALRKQHEQLVAQERALLKQLNAPVDARVDAGLGRAQSAQAKLDARDAEIDSIVAERVALMNAVLDEESQKLVGYRARLGELEQDAIIVVGGVAYANYRKVQRRFYDLVLRADVGIVDVAWAIREQHRLNAERLTRDRARSLKALADEYRDITDEAESPE
jgi:hypothetical protein